MNKKESKHRADLQKHLSNYLVIEGVSGRLRHYNDRTPQMLWRDDRTALAAFQNTLLQALSSQLPTVVIRAEGSNASVPLSMIVEIAGRKIPTLVLDCHDRTAFSEAIAGGRFDRDTLVDKAIESDKARNEELWAKGTVDSFDHDRIAFFYDVLNGDGDQNTVVSVLKAAADHGESGCDGTLVTLSHRSRWLKSGLERAPGSHTHRRRLHRLLSTCLTCLQVSRCLQLQSLWKLPTAAVS